MGVGVGWLRRMLVLRRGELRLKLRGGSLLPRRLYSNA